MFRKNKRIILSDGIGNQLFQYLFALKLSQMGFSVILDGRKLKKENLFWFGFQTELKFRRNIFHFILFRFNLFLKFNLGLNIPLNSLFPNKRYIQKNPFEEEISTEFKIFEGYFQNIHLLGMNKIPKIPFNPAIAISKNIQIDYQNSCAIHFRSGDYKAAKFEVLSIEYYRKAINETIKKDINKFYVFTTDLDYANQILNSLPNLNYIFVSPSLKSDFEELKIMASFKNIIIANSTFSLWGALLESKDKFVIAPKNWIFRNVDPTSCLYEDNWLIL